MWMTMGKVQPRSRPFFASCSSVYNQLSNNGNLAIYLSFAALTGQHPSRALRIIHLHIFFGPTDIYASSAKHECHLLLLFCCENLHSRWDLILFLLLPENVCKVHLWLFQRYSVAISEKHFWWLAARKWMFFFSCAFLLKRNIVNRNVHMQCQRGRREYRNDEKSHRDSTHCIGGKASAGLSSRMHGKNNIYGNN